MPATKESETFQHNQVLRHPDGTLFELGRGAMGVTYKAFDTNLRCNVALKVINAFHLDSETARARFLREARAAAGLRHRNVASVYHLGSDEQSFFYAMEWVDGLTVESLVKKYGGGIPVVDALQIAAQVARALSAASRHGLIHRDIKPANVMVAPEEDGDDELVVKVIDFGLARSAVGGEGSAIITMGGFVGTPQYASPEQLEEKDLDIRSDIYSLGVTLWYMLTGRPPFEGTLGSVFVQQMTKEPPWERVAHLPPEVRSLLARVLQKDPARRPQNAVDLRREIEATLKNLPAEAPHINLLNLPAGGKSINPGSEAASATNPAPARSGDSSLEGSAPTRAVTIAPGARLEGRYELLTLAGEGSCGRVFRARDLESAGRPVAVKVLPAGVLSLPAERQRLHETIDKLRQAPHPCLKRVYALGEAGHVQFVVEEWVYGFSLLDVLRSRGHLRQREVLPLLAQAAPAIDHAQAKQLYGLELGLHQIAVDFPWPATGSETPVDRKLVGTDIQEWPAFSLKFDALGIAQEAGASGSWGADMTMLPQSAALRRDTQTSIRGLVESTYLFALGTFVYELLSGAPPSLRPSGNGGGVRYVPLPELNEAANGVLRKALSSNPPFASGAEFLSALGASCNFTLPASAHPVTQAGDPPSDPLPSARDTSGLVVEARAGQTAIDEECAPEEARAIEQTFAAEQTIVARHAPFEETPVAEETLLDGQTLIAGQTLPAGQTPVAEQTPAGEQTPAADRTFKAGQTFVAAQQGAEVYPLVASPAPLAAGATRVEPSRPLAGASAPAAAKTNSSEVPVSAPVLKSPRRPRQIAMGAGAGALVAAGILGLLVSRPSPHVPVPARPGRVTATTNLTQAPLAASITPAPASTTGDVPVVTTVKQMPPNPPPVAEAPTGSVGTPNPPAIQAEPTPAANNALAANPLELPPAPVATPTTEGSGKPPDLPLVTSAPASVIGSGPALTASPVMPAPTGTDTIAAGNNQTSPSQPPVAAIPAPTAAKATKATRADAAKGKPDPKRDLVAAAHGTSTPTLAKDKPLARNDATRRPKPAPTEPPPAANYQPGFMR